MMDLCWAVITGMHNSILLNCSVCGEHGDSAIYRVPTTNMIQWGDRVYYYNCHREGGNDFGWYANNLPAGVKCK